MEKIVKRISFTPTLWERVSDAADARGMSATQWIVSTLADRLEGRNTGPVTCGNGDG